MPLRTVFFGTAPLACASLEALARSPDFQVAAVVSQPDKPRGRDLQVQPTAVKAAAAALGLPVLQPLRARDPVFIAEIHALNPDLGVVAAYGQILPQALLDTARLGFLNVHTSLLPRHRGAAPIQWAILEGDAETGVTIMKMDAGLDTGPIVARRAVPISGADTAQTLHDTLARVGADLLVETAPLYASGRLSPQPQGEGATYARKIEKADGAIDWREPARVIERKIRAFNPWPGAHTDLEIGGQRRRVKIWQAAAEAAVGAPGEILAGGKSALVIACGEGALRLGQVQPEGRKRMSIADFLAGHAVTAVAPPAG